MFTADLFVDNRLNISHIANFCFMLGYRETVTVVSYWSVVFEAPSHHVFNK